MYGGPIPSRDVDPVDYDLAKIERELQDVKLGRADATNNLQRQVWRLCLKYHEKLKQCGYDQFVKQQPKLAVGHIMKRITTHAGLGKRMLLTLRLRKKELEGNFPLFMRELSNEAQTVDRHKSAQGYRDDDSASDDDTTAGSPRGRKRKRKASGSKGSDSVNNSCKKGQESEGTSGNKRSKRGPPPCLLGRCDGKHLISQCPIATE